MKRLILIYGSLLTAFAALLWFLLDTGGQMQAPSSPVSSGAAGPSQGHLQVFGGELLHNLGQPMGVLILQIIIIVIFARLFGLLFHRFRQPVVIGEVIAGIVLGPSLLGGFFPGAFDFIFPASSMDNLHLLSQIGLLLFMFIIGMELDTRVLGRKAYTAIFISHTGIMLPFTAGVLLALFLFKSFAPAGVSFTAFALFMGIALSITAFPVLARIIQERGMTKTRIGTLALTCAASDDITAWCILAAVVAIVKAGNLSNAIFSMLLSIFYVLVMIYLVKPLLKRMGDIYTSKEAFNKTVVAFILILPFASAGITQMLGIHALFGAFLAGVIMPQKSSFKSVLVEKIEDVSLVLLLPLFFAFTGLRTRIGLLDNAYLWEVCGLICVTAVVFKLGGSSLASRLSGNSWRDSLTLGTLMNTRGLMELVVLNIGYDLGILKPEIFAMMVIMALLATFMTGPVLNLLRKRKKGFHSRDDRQDSFRILISFAAPRTGSHLLRLASALQKHSGGQTEVTALHVTPTSELSIQEAIIYEQESFMPIKSTAEELDIPVDTFYRASEDITYEIISFSRKGNFDLLLAGSARPLFNANVLGGKIKNLLEAADCMTGILLEKNFKGIRHTLVLHEGPQDNFLLRLAERILADEKQKVQLLDVNGSFSMPEEQQDLTSFIQVINGVRMNKAFLEDFDLLLISLSYWKKISASGDEWMADSPSILIVKNKREIK
jgi:Kef-type K+ transport system membrane component KefB